MISTHKKAGESSSFALTGNGGKNYAWTLNPITVNDESYYCPILRVQISGSVGAGLASDPAPFQEKERKKRSKLVVDGAKPSLPFFSSWAKAPLSLVVSALALVPNISRRLPV